MVPTPGGGAGQREDMNGIRDAGPVVGCVLVVEEEESADIKAHDNIWAAIWTIIVADAVMSLDNAIAIAAAAKGDFTLIVIGLVISIPIIIVGATLIAKVLDRFPWLGLVGAGLIGW